MEGHATARQGMAGKAWQARLGEARLGLVRHGRPLKKVLDITTSIYYIPTYGGYMSNYNRNQKTVYIPDYLKPTWEQMIKESGSKGAGYILLEAWCKIRKIKIPEYQSKGDKSKARMK